MYKPFTVELFCIQQHLKEIFELEHFIQMPISRDTVILRDTKGEQIAFTCQNKTVSQIPLPTTLSKEEAVAYIRSLRSNGKIPELKTFQDVTRWWIDTPNPLTYQQALGLPDDLYIHFLANGVPDYEEVLKIVRQEVVSEAEYKAIRLWCRNGNFHRCYLGAYGVDGTGDSYKFIWNYGQEDAVTFIFYLKNEYYCFMHGIPYPI